ncbi:MAG: 1-deoxy-D-xylulose-5-phosphate reductoisomerase [Hyphomicrobiaceae bacterium]
MQSSGVRTLDVACTNVAATRQSDPQKISILGATGSIGDSTLDLIALTPEAFEIIVLTANTNVQKLAQQARRHRARKAVIADDSSYNELKSELSGSGIQVAAGAEALDEAGSEPADCVVAAIVGAAGLRPSLAAVKQGQRLALANKECLVAAGKIFMAEVAAAGATLLPVDSEHSAVHQAIEGEQKEHIERITLTASGGPFRTWCPQKIADATPQQALQHPNWSMGSKISIDSATLMNKGLELIEAYHLFPVEIEQLDVVVHPQSIVHCLVEFCDGSVMAQMAVPDMRTPIAHSLAWPRRIPTPTKRLRLTDLGTLTFEQPDVTKFPALQIARGALACGGSAPNILNASNERAVSAFLQGQIGFSQISEVVADCLDIATGRGLLEEPSSLQDVLTVDHEARRISDDLMFVRGRPYNRGAAVSSENLK